MVTVGDAVMENGKVTMTDDAAFTINKVDVTGQTEINGAILTLSGPEWLYQDMGVCFR